MGAERVLYSETDCRNIVSQLFKGNSDLEKKILYQPLSNVVEVSELQKVKAAPTI